MASWPSTNSFIHYTGHIEYHILNYYSVLFKRSSVDLSSAKIDDAQITAIVKDIITSLNLKNVFLR